MPAVVRPAAAADIEEAYRWYQSQRPGLGEEFLVAIGRVIDALSANPESFPLVHRDVRRALLRRFPYGIYYRLAGDQVVVTACFHASRDPRRWQARS